MHLCVHTGESGNNQDFLLWLSGICVDALYDRTHRVEWAVRKLLIVSYDLSIEIEKSRISRVCSARLIYNVIAVCIFDVVVEIVQALVENTCAANIWGAGQPFLCIHFGSDNGATRGIYGR